MPVTTLSTVRPHPVRKETDDLSRSPRCLLKFPGDKNSFEIIRSLSCWWAARNRAVGERADFPTETAEAPFDSLAATAENDPAIFGGDAIDAP